jgi:uncharacterized protein YbjQ (UPF0145 family)
LYGLFDDVKQVPTANDKENSMADEKQMGELSAKVEALAGEFTKLPEVIANAMASALKPVTDEFAALKANALVKEEAEKAELVTKVVKANLLTEPVAKELTVNALKELSAKIVSGKAAGLNGAPLGNEVDEDEFKGVDLNAIFDQKGA